MANGSLLRGDAPPSRAARGAPRRAGLRRAGWVERAGGRSARVVVGLLACAGGLRAASAQDGRPETSPPAGEEDWFVRLAAVDGELRDLQAGPVEPGALDQLGSARVRAAVARAALNAMQVREGRVRLALRQTQAREAEFAARLRHERADLAAAEARAAHDQQALTDAVARVRSAGLPQAVQVRFERWYGLFERVDWTAVWDGEGDEAALFEARAGLAPPHGEAPNPLIGAVLVSADQLETSLRLAHRAAAAVEPDNAGYAEAIASYQAELVEIQRDRAAQMATVRRLEDDAAATTASPEDRLPEILAAYTALESAVGDLPLHVDRERWCGLLIHKGVAELLKGEDPSLTFSHAVAAWGGGCASTAAGVKAPESFSAAWDAALMAGSGTEPSTVWYQASLGRWQIDGVEPGGVGKQRVRLQPGLHRFEFLSDDGQFAWAVEETAAGASLVLTPERGTIAIDEAALSPGPAPAPVLAAEIEESPVPDVVAVQRSGPAVWAGAGAGWVRVAGYDHVGGRVAVRVVADGPRAVRAGGVLDVDASVGSHAYYLTPTLSAPVLVRAQVGGLLSVGGGDHGPLAASIATEVGMIAPDQALLLSLVMAVDWRTPGRQVELVLDGGPTLPVWADGMHSLDYGAHFSLLRRI